MTALAVAGSILGLMSAAQLVVLVRLSRKETPVAPPPTPLEAPEDLKSRIADLELEIVVVRRSLEDLDERFGKYVSRESGRRGRARQLEEQTDLDEALAAASQDNGKGDPPTRRTRRRRRTRR